MTWGAPVDLSFLNKEMKDDFDKALEEAKKIKMELISTHFRVSPEKGILPSNKNTPSKSDAMLDIPINEKLFE